jgi:hypothetical protein
MKKNARLRGSPCWILWKYLPLRKRYFWFVKEIISLFRKSLGRNLIHRFLDFWINVFKNSFVTKIREKVFFMHQYIFLNLSSSTFLKSTTVRQLQL